MKPQQKKQAKPKLNLATFGRRIAGAYKRTLGLTGKLVVEVLKADAAILKTFKNRGDQKKARRRLTTDVRGRVKSASQKNNVSSILSQVFSIVRKRPDIRKSWLAGGYGRPFTITLAKRPKGGDAMSPKQSVYAYVRREKMTVRDFTTFARECAKLLTLVRRKHVRGQIRFTQGKGGLVLVA